jgi:phenylalanyl-tRNA synthetase beta chain
MPTIEISKLDLEALCKKKFNLAELQELLENNKISLESQEKDVLTLKIEDTNRADLLSVEGIARQLRGILKKETGIQNYKVNDSNFVVRVDSKVKKVRPYTVCAVIKDLKFDENFIKQIIQLQEKLTDTFGKKRKEAAIGVYDFDKIKWPIDYTTFKPEALAFTPLGMIEMLNLKQILEKHEKGQQYGYLLKDKKEYPIFIDSGKNVLSMPPIINSDYSGKVTEDTKNIFIEVSGFDMERISFILNIITSAVAERHGKLFSVQIKDKKKFKTPEFKIRKKVLLVQEINSLLGLELKAKEIVEILEKMRYNAKTDKEKITVEIPFNRRDVIHNVDIIEDIAAVYGYKNISPLEPKICTLGSILEETKSNNNLANSLAGFGFQETLSFVLSSKKEQLENMNLPTEKNSESIIEIQNPVSENYSCLRKSLLPGIMKFFSNNIDKDFPQKIFELGKIVLPDARAENKTKEENHLSLAISHAKANLTEATELLFSVFKNKKIELKSKECASFISGRCAEIIINSKSVGILGEIHPKVLSSWKLRMPVVALELNLDF